MDLTIIQPARNVEATIEKSLKAIGDAIADTTPPNNPQTTPKHSLSAKLIIFESGGVPELDMMELGIADCEFVHIPSKPNMSRTEERYSAILGMWAMALEMVTTEYLMRVDADLVIPSDSIHQLMAGMLGNKRLGAYSIAYPQWPGKPRIHDHQTCGCALFSVKALREIAPIRRKRTCDCLYISSALIEKGWEVRTIDGMQADHLAH